jgi:thymidylate kinase
MTGSNKGANVARRPLIISFSGLDGSGKSTQINNVRDQLTAMGYRVKVLAFWDNVVVATKYREGFVHKVYKSEQGIGAPDKPVNRRDKNVRKWYLNLARHGLYLADAIHLRQVIGQQAYSDAHILIMDRYIYDELANLPLANSASRAFARWIGRTFVPTPDLALLLDADPEAAHKRKPEYPVDFMTECRTWYHRLAGLLGTITIVPPLPLEEAKRTVMDHVREVLGFAGIRRRELELSQSANDAVA